MTYSINDLIAERITGEWGAESKVNSAVNVLRTTNFTNDGRLNFANVITRDIDERKVQKKHLLPGDIIIEKSGGSPKQPVGRVVYFDNHSGVYLCNNFTSILRPSDLVYSKYLFYILFFMHLSKKTLNYQNKTTGIINLQLDRYLNSEKVTVPEVAEQRRIVEILDQTDLLRQKRREAIKLLDNYLTSSFIELFGDLTSNPKEIRELHLSELAEIKSGVTKGRKLDVTLTVEVPYMRVANVQDGYIDLNEIKTIDVLPSDVEKYRLEDGDLLLTEGGDPDKLGRGGVWRNNIKDCIHQNHIFRVRLDQDRVLPEYASALISSPYGKAYFLRAAKQTTGIATINSTQLKKFPFLLADMKHQKLFAAKTKAVAAIRKTMLEQSLELDNQFNALMQKAFNGEL